MSNRQFYFIIISMNAVHVKKPIFIFLLLTFCIGSIFSQNKSPLVTKINTFPLSETKILISWELPKQTKGLSISGLEIYRDTSPFTLQTDLSGKKPIAILPYNALSYTDTVNGKNEYFYAVASLVKEADYTAREEELFYDEQFDTFDSSGGKRYKLILPGVNASSSGVKGKIKSTAKKTKVPAEKILEPYVFEEDLLAPSGGDHYMLFDILKTYFIPKHYQKCSIALKKFLLVNRKEDVQNRAIFYLAQCNYYSGNYKEALKYFLQVQDFFEQESLVWIKSSLNLYSIPSTQ